MNKFFLFVLIILSSAPVVAQTDSAFAVADTTYYYDSTYYDNAYAPEEDVVGQPDSMVIAKRSFDSTKIDELKSDPELEYKEAPTVAETLWDRIMAWLARFFESLFKNAVGTNWGRVLMYVLGVVVLIVVIMLILKVDAFKVFYAGQGTSTMQYNVLHENIHEIDFEKEIQHAVNQTDYRKGVRLVFLYSLKILSDKQLIRWEQGKTNHEYVNELKTGDVKKGLNELSFYFDYAWYGNFAVNADMFNKVQNTFNEWRKEVR